MGKKLVVVESPAKARTIRGILGSGYRAVALDGFYMVGANGQNGSTGATYVYQTAKTLMQTLPKGGELGLPPFGED